MSWYLEVLKKYAVFSGRARRTEYWMFLLGTVLIALVLSVIAGIVGVALDSDLRLLSTVYALAVLIPSLAVSVRRLHDTSRSGWWLLLGLVPIIGVIVLLVFMVQDSHPGDNQYGPSPKLAAVA